MISSKCDIKDMVYMVSAFPIIESHKIEKAHTQCKPTLALSYDMKINPFWKA